MTHFTSRYALTGFALSLLLSTAACAPSGQSDSSASDDAKIVASDEAQTFLVRDQDAFYDAVDAAGPGDTIALADGTWTDFEIIFKGAGEESKPVTLTAQTKGKVILSGQSNLRLSGEHLVVSGLVFKDGYSPTSEVVAFRSSSSDLANHSRVTEIVIDNYNPPQRREADFWVMIYGKHNRFDHSHLVGKRNNGVTMAVRMNTEASRENYHRIDHNYFGPRPMLGSNGGETLRVGTSHYSLSDSFTVVENNYFDRTNGELEIISNKSGKNEFRNNTFFEGRGTLTMRHGNNNLVEGNVFFGNDKDHTGGVRVINGGQIIRNNYMEGLKGTRFGGAFVVMNGVPDSPINRYHQVSDAVIENNSILRSDNIQLGAGSDTERSAVPVDSVFKRNLVYNADGHDAFTIYDDMSGIDFGDNALAAGTPEPFAAGFKETVSGLTRASNGLLYPNDADAVGVPKDLVVTTKEMTGPDWYPKLEPTIEFDSGKTISVSPGEGAIFAALQNAQAGDIISLGAGNYIEPKFLKVDKPLTFMGKGAANIAFERSALFEILDGGSLKIDGLNITGAQSPDNAGNSVIRTSPYSMLQNYRLEILNSNFVDIDTNHTFNIVNVAKDTFADYILIQNSTFKNVTGSVLKLDKEADDNGIYNAEYVTIENSKFENIGQALVNFYRGGTDESTFGPHFEFHNSEVVNVGNDKRNKSKSVFELHGVQVTNISDVTISGSPKILINHTVGEPKTKISGNTFIGMPSIEVNELNSVLDNTAMIDDNQVRAR